MIDREDLIKRLDTFFARFKEPTQVFEDGDMLIFSGYFNDAIKLGKAGRVTCARDGSTYYALHDLLFALVNRLCLGDELKGLIIPGPGFPRVYWNKQEYRTYEPKPVGSLEVIHSIHDEFHINIPSSGLTESEISEFQAKMNQALLNAMNGVTAAPPISFRQIHSNRVNKEALRKWRDLTFDWYTEEDQDW